MKKIIIAVVIAVAVIATVGAGYMYMRNKDADEGAAQNQSAFQPASTDGQAFTATVTATTKKGKKTVTVMKTDGQGTSEYAIDGGEKTRLVFTSDYYYACSQNNCTKISSDASAGFVADPKTYDVSQSDINNAADKATKLAQQPCPTGEGTCDVWKTNGFTNDGSTATVYIDAQSRRVVQIETENEDGQKVKMVYVYGPVTIEIPSKAREVNFEIPSGPIEQ